MFCRKCGTEFRAGARFCGKCGSPKPVIEPSELCEKKDRKRDRRTGEKGSYPADSCTGSDSHVSVSETSGSSGTDTEGEVPGESGDRKSDCHRNCSSSDLYGNRNRCCENSGQASAGAGDTGAAGGYR